MLHRLELRHLFSLALAACCSVATVCADEGNDKNDKAEANKKGSTLSFSEPVRLSAAGELISVESPGYASPCWTDVDGDGSKELLVGQFNQGRIKIYKNLKDNNLEEGYWLEADGKTAEVPGVW